MRSSAPKQFAFWQAGPDPTLILLPGIFGGTSVWGPTMRLLAGRHCMCALDLPGLAKATAGRVTVVDASIALAAWLEHAEVDRPVLVGHSLGGTVALVVAANRPDLVGGLVLVDAPAVPIGRGMARSLASVIRSTRQEPNRSWGNTFGDVWRMRPHVLWRACRDILSTDASPYLTGLDGRVRLIWGELDRIVPLAIAERMMALLPSADLRIVPGAGHSPMEEAPQRFVALLLEHLASESPAEADAASLAQIAPAPLAAIEAGVS